MQLFRVLVVVIDGCFVGGDQRLFFVPAFWEARGGTDCCWLVVSLHLTAGTIAPLTTGVTIFPPIYSTA